MKYTVELAKPWADALLVWIVELGHRKNIYG